MTTTFATIDQDGSIVSLLGAHEPGTAQTDALIRRASVDGLRVVALDVDAREGDRVRVDDDGCAFAIITEN